MLKISLFSCIEICIPVFSFDKIEALHTVLYLKE